MIEEINIQTIILLGVVVIGIWEFSKKIMEMLTAFGKQHDRAKKWDEMSVKIEEMSKETGKVREEIVNQFNQRLDEINEDFNERIDSLNNKIDENYTDTEAKVQELNSRMLILTKSVSAVLDGLKQQGCNGQVTKAKEELDAFLMERAYD